MKIIILTLTLYLPLLSLSQIENTTIKEQDIKEMKVERNYSSKYKRQLDLLEKTYPMALKAKELIDEYEKDLSDLNKKRLQRKYSKKMYKKLKSDFTYSIRDLYQSEGAILMKLVHRETGMTVNQILKKYRNQFQTSFYRGVASIFGQNLNAIYDANGDDWITESVIHDIESGKISFNKNMITIDKAEYKQSMAEYKDGRKKSRKSKRKKRKGP